MHLPQRAFVTCPRAALLLTAGCLGRRTVRRKGRHAVSQRVVDVHQ
jgi:hypothetical protein